MAGVAGAIEGMRLSAAHRGLRNGPASPLRGRRLGGVTLSGEGPAIFAADGLSPVQNRTLTPNS
jgi:hypothetical protein